MDRYAVFIDAGYLLAEGGELCVGTIRRPELACDYPTLVADIAQLAGEDCGLGLLRTYWYDGARDRVPTGDHLRVAELPDVKVRLGLVSGGRQKGVDALIYRDLTTLARERAITDAYLVSGDEDLREAVSTAQDLGVRVVLLGIPTADQQNRAPGLVREADRLLMLGREVLSRSLTRSAVTMDEGDDGHRPGRDFATTSDPSALLRAELAGQEFARGWLGQATPAEVTELLGQSPFIPKDLDVQLIVSAEAEIGPLRDVQDVRHAVRSGFWKAVTEATVSEADEAAPAG